MLAAGSRTVRRGPKEEMPFRGRVSSFGNPDQTKMKQLGLGGRPAPAMRRAGIDIETMRGLTPIFIGLLLAAAAGPALAQSATKIGQHNAWGTYSYQSENGKVCYVLTVPTEKQPASLDHGDIFFFVSQKPGQNVSYEPQFIASYDFQDNSKVSVAVGDKNFSMFTRGKSAWMENAAEEPQLVAAMRSGSDMKISAKSGRGNTTSYTFSLKGISAALQSIASCK
jgi:invasion protein IalB